MSFTGTAALNTNILAHAEGANGAEIKRTALRLVQKLPEDAMLHAPTLLPPCAVPA
jgi:predicted nucleic acid-binding protein